MKLKENFEFGFTGADYSPWHSLSLFVKMLFLCLGNGNIEALCFFLGGGCLFVNSYIRVYVPFLWLSQVNVDGNFSGRDDFGGWHSKDKVTVTN